MYFCAIILFDYILEFGGTFMILCNIYTLFFFNEQVLSKALSVTLLFSDPLTYLNHVYDFLCSQI